MFVFRTPPRGIKRPIKTTCFFFFFFFSLSSGPLKSTPAGRGHEQQYIGLDGQADESDVVVQLAFQPLKRHLDGLPYSTSKRSWPITSSDTQQVGL